MRRREGDGCPVWGVLQVVGDKWTLLIVRDLAGAPRRTTELLARLHPISSRTLMDRLRDMERDALIERRDFGGSPPHVEYVLTARGRLLMPLLDALRAPGRGGPRNHVGHRPPPPPDPPPRRAPPRGRAPRLQRLRRPLQPPRVLLRLLPTRRRLGPLGR